MYLYLNIMDISVKISKVHEMTLVKSLSIINFALILTFNTFNFFSFRIICYLCNRLEAIK